MLTPDQEQALAKEIREYQENVGDAATALMAEVFFIAGVESAHHAADDEFERCCGYLCESCKQDSGAERSRVGGYKAWWHTGYTILETPVYHDCGAAVLREGRYQETLTQENTNGTDSES